MWRQQAIGRAGRPGRPHPPALPRKSAPRRTATGALHRAVGKSVSGVFVGGGGNVPATPGRCVCSGVRHGRAPVEVCTAGDRGRAHWRCKRRTRRLMTRTRWRPRPARAMVRRWLPGLDLNESSHALPLCCRPSCPQPPLGLPTLVHMRRRVELVLPPCPPTYYCARTVASHLVPMGGDYKRWSMSTEPAASSRLTHVALGGPAAGRHWDSWATERVYIQIWMVDLYMFGWGQARSSWPQRSDLLSSWMRPHGGAEQKQIDARLRWGTACAK